MKGARIGVMIDDKGVVHYSYVDDIVFLADAGVELQDLLDVVQDFVI